MSDHGEHAALAESAVVMPLPELATLVISGTDRQSWLAGMVTSDVRALPPGQASYALVVNKTGRLLCEVWVCIDTDCIRVGMRRDLLPSVRDHLEGFLVMEDAVISVDDASEWWIAFGPKADEVGRAARRLGGLTGQGALGGLPFVLLTIAPGSSANAAEDLTSGSGAVLATPDGWASIRIERLLPAFGIDFEAGCYPQEARLERLGVSFNKGCYVGQEAVFMLEKRGHPSKRLARLHAATDSSVAAGDRVYDAAGEEVGVVTSVAASNDGIWAIAMLRYKATTDGQVLRVREASVTVREPAA